MSSTEALELGFVRQWEEERARIRRVNLLCTLATIAIISVLFFFLIYLEKYSISLIILSFFIIFTNATRFVVYRLYLVPRFFLELRSPDEAHRAAAWSVITGDRERYLKPIVVERREPSKPENIVALTLEQVVAWDDLDKIVWWERFTRRWALVWLLCFVGVALMLWRLFATV